MQIPGVSSAIPWGKAFEIAQGALDNDFGKSTLGFIGSGPFVNYEADYQAELNGTKESAKKTGILKVFEYIKNGFSWGDIGTLVGIGLKIVSAKLFKQEKDVQPSPASTVFNLVANILTFGGFLLSRLSQYLDLPRKRALGPEKAGKLFRIKAEQESGEKVLEDLSVESVRAGAAKLTPKLVYEDEQKGLVFSRNDLELNNIPGGISAILHGPPGTGKTTGAIVILSNWADMVESQGCEPVIKKLNLAVLDKYAKKKRQEVLSQLSMVKNIHEGLGKHLMKEADDPLIAFETLIHEARDLVNKAEERNKNLQPGEKPQRVAIFMDEFDKIHGWALQGADQERLSRLIQEFNNLFGNAKHPVILASNKRVKDFEQLPVPKDEVLAPFLDRLRAKQIPVESPTPKAQAEIIANNILALCKPLMDFAEIREDGSSEGKIVDLNCSYSEQKRKLKEYIYKYVSRLAGSNNINGRHLEIAIAGLLVSNLSTKANELRQEAADGFGVTDKEWIIKGGIDKAKIAGVKITLQNILEAVKKQQEFYLNSDEAEGKSVVNNDVAFGAMKAYIKASQEEIRKSAKAMNVSTGAGNPADTLKVLVGAYDVVQGENFTSYVQKADESKLFEHEGKKYIHCIKVTRPIGANKEKNQPTVQIGFCSYGSDAYRGLMEPQGFSSRKEQFDWHWSDSYMLNDFISKLQEEIAIVFDDKFGFGLFSKLFRGVMSKDPEAFIKCFQELADKVDRTSPGPIF